MFNFRNIDEFIPYKFEKVGELKGKRWYIDSSNHRMGLFKPKRYAFKDRKVFCANHYGEFIGNILAVQADINACETELAYLSKYYSNIHKERNNGTPEEKDGCIIYSQLSKGDILEPGKIAIERFKMKYRDQFKALIQNNDISMSKANDNIEVVFASVETSVRDFYRALDTHSETYIQARVQEVRRKVIQMAVYDSLYGNYDRHDENWSMQYNNGKIDLYPLYDNERVLGLYENQNFIEEALRKEDIEQVAQEKFFSRMRVPGEEKGYSTYKDILTYLMKKYPQETVEILDMQLERNTPQNVRKYLEECEGLPGIYVDFGTQMYTYRNNFARDLLERNRHQENMQSIEGNMLKNISSEER